MQNSVNPKLKFDYRQLGAGAAPGSPAGVLSVAFRGRFSLIQFFKQPGQFASAISQRAAPELCMKRSPTKTEVVGNPGCPMHPRPRVRLRGEGDERVH